MTIGSTAVQTAGSTGNGATVEFSFSFRVQAYGDVAAADQIEVVRVTIASAAEVVLTKTTDYTVSINADQDASPGGAITMLVAPSSAYKIYIRRSPSYLQPVDLQAQGAFSAPVIENSLDQLVMQILDLRARQLNAPHFGVQGGSSFDGRIRSAPAAGQAVLVNAAGTGFELGLGASATVSPAMQPVVSAVTTILALVALGVPTAMATALVALSSGATLNDCIEALTIDDYGDARWASLEENNTHEGDQVAPSYTATLADAIATLRALRTGSATVDGRLRAASTAVEVGSFTAHPLALVYNGVEKAQLNASGNLDFTAGGGTAIGLRAPTVAGESARYQDVFSVLPFSSGASTIAATETRYVGLGGISTASTVVSYRAPRAGTLRNLYNKAAGAPGGSDTYVYTVMVNGGATALTATSTGAASASADTTHAVSVAAGDNIDIRCVVSATGSTRTHQCSVEMSLA